MDNPMEKWEGFVKELRDRMEMGKAVYGDKSFLETPTQLSHEIKTEILDICGWSFILLCRLENIRKEIDREYKDLIATKKKFKTEGSASRNKKRKKLIEGEPWKDEYADKVQNDRPML